MPLRARRSFCDGDPDVGRSWLHVHKSGATHECASDPNRPTYPFCRKVRDPSGNGHADAWLVQGVCAGATMAGILIRTTKRVTAGRHEPRGRRILMSYPFRVLGEEEGVRVWRDAGGEVRANVRHRLKLHSEEGFALDGDAPGTRDLAIAILLDFGTAAEDAVALCGEFMQQFLLALPYVGGEIPADSVYDWMEARMTDGPPDEEWSGEEDLPAWATHYAREAGYLLLEGGAPVVAELSARDV